ncbi:DinB family protein [Lacibacter sp. MH-610]|uniref:DinB family protein n=1 Tax=Lacibacter sp. MH-610 TaxID=3020883 RepID=UPI0038924415
MLQLLQNYAAFNVWANQTITDAILEMEEHTHQQIVKSSFPNLYATVLHMWDAESIWWQRMEGHAQLLIPGKEFNPTMKEAVNGLLNQSREWSSWMNRVTEEQLQNEFHYKNLKGEAFTSGVWQVVHHLFNHGTYHRGQLVTMMRELGSTEIPSTDFIHWYRKIR